MEIRPEPCVLWQSRLEVRFPVLSRDTQVGLLTFLQHRTLRLLVGNILFFANDSALHVYFSILSAVSPSADAAALLSQRCLHATPKCPSGSGSGSGVGPPCGGHSGALLLHCRAARRVGAGSTKPGAGLAWLFFVF